MFRQAVGRLAAVRPLRQYRQYATAMRPLENRMDRARYTEQMYMQDVATKTAVSLGVTAGACASSIGAFMLVPALAPAVVPALVGSFLTGLVSCFKVDNYNPRMSDDGRQIVDDPEREKWATVLFASQGVIVAPIVYMCMDSVPEALLCTGALMATTITAARHMPQGSMLPYGTFLYGGVWCLVAVGVASVFFPSLHTINLYGGLGLFMVVNAYDTHTALESYRNQTPDALGHSINFGLNAINMFVRLLQIFRK